MNIDLLTLSQSIPDLTISVKASDLVSAIRQMFAEELEKALKKYETKPKLVNRDEAMAQLEVSSTTLWRLQKLGIIRPIRVGCKCRYKQDDIDAILSNKEQE